tara:strand:+ start:7699 stop:7929 length:231 start_codon:yes stop_codon:yes gene_type:complete
MSNEETLVIDTPEGIEMYRMLAVKSALGLEVRTGMKMSRGVNVFQQGKAILESYGIKPKGTKQGVFEQLENLLVLE